MYDSEIRKIEIKTENIKLSSFLKFAGIVTTGGEAKEIINSGKVLVDGEKCFAKGKKLSTGNVVCINYTNFYEVKSCENS